METILVLPIQKTGILRIVPIVSIVFKKNSKKPKLHLSLARLKKPKLHLSLARLKKPKLRLPLARLKGALFRFVLSFLSF